MIVDCTMDLKQKERADRAVDCINKGELGILTFMENLKDELISREAEMRANAVNAVCYVLLKLGKERGYIFSITESASLFRYLLTKVEDSGHLSELLISTIQYLLISNFGNENRLQDDELDYLLVILFANNNAQSYGQKDRIILYSIFEYLLNIYSTKLLSPSTQQKTIQHFLGSAQGEQDPRVLIIIFKIHQKLASQLKLGIFVEDMFDIISCYFPIDYEPNESDKGPPVTLKMLRQGLEDCLLANNSFAPFCFQLICEKLTENDAEPEVSGLDSNSINRQLEICKFFIKAGKHFINIGKILERTLDDLMAALRSIFLNPAQNRLSLNITEKIVKETMQILLKALTDDDENGMDEMKGIERKMTEMTIENIEPFILQAEMGTMGNGLRLVKCLAESGMGKESIQIIGGRCLYWLNLLINGQTLRSPQNREEIAMEAIESVPYWLQLFITEGAGASDYEKTIFPILDEIFSMEDVAEKEELLKIKCRILIPFLLFFTESTTDNIRINLFKERKKFLDFFHQIFRKICLRESQICFSGEINQFLALYALCESNQINDQFFRECLAQNKCVNILPSIICPFSSELEGKNAKKRISMDNSMKAINAILAISFDKIFVNNQSGIQNKEVKEISECCEGIENAAKRIINNHELADAFYNGLKMRIDAFFDDQNSLLQQMPKTTIFDSIAVLLQNIGSALLEDNMMGHFHEDLCKWATRQISYGNIKLKIRTFWLLLNQSKNFEYQNEFIGKVLKLAQQSDEFGYFDLLFLEETLCSFYFGIINRGILKPELGDQIRWTLVRIFEAYNQFAGSHIDVGPQSTTKGANGNGLYVYVFSNFFQNSRRHQSVKIDRMEAEMAAQFRIELLETRCSLLTANPNKMAAELRKFFDKIILGNENVEYSTIDRLLDFFSPQNDPDKCFYKKSLLWRQRIFSIVVPIFVDYFEGIKEECHPKKLQMLTLIGPLMEILGRIPTMDSLENELIRLGPLIAQSIPIAFDDNFECQFSLASSILNGLCLLLKKQKLGEKANADGGGHFSQEIVHSIVLCLCKSFCRPNLPPSIIVKILECLQIVAHRFGPSKREWLAPLCIPVIRTLAEMASNRKRFIRRKAADTRNSWELIF